MLTAAVNSAGGVMGKMISLSSIAVAVAATGMKPSDEGKLFRFTLRHSILLATVIVILGGMGSLRGAFVGALLIGLIDTLGRSSFPEFSLFAIFAPMALILVIRPTGLFGRRV